MGNIILEKWDKTYKDKKKKYDDVQPSGRYQSFPTIYQKHYPYPLGFKNTTHSKHNKLNNIVGLRTCLGIKTNETK